MMLVAGLSRLAAVTFFAGLGVFEDVHLDRPLSGFLDYSGRDVYVDAGQTVTVTSYGEGGDTSNTGWLHIRARNIYISGWVDAAGRGYGGGSGSAGGGAGGRGSDGDTSYTGHPYTGGGGGGGSGNASTAQDGPGSIVAWGYNPYGQCDVPGPNTDFVAVAAGWVHSVGLKGGGSIVAWGWNNEGQCNVPAPNTDFVAVAAGQEHSLALKGDESIVAWGSNYYGQCNVPAPNTDFVAVAPGMGMWHSLGLKADGSVAAWGRNYEGQCNVPDPNTDFVAIARGGLHSLGLKADGSIVAWGRDFFGQCDVPRPNTDFVAVAGGYGHSLAVKGDGSIVAWGLNDHGQCNVPAPNTDFVAVAGGGGHSLALKADGSIAAWGRNVYGQCNVPASNTDFVAVAGGAYHSLGLKGGAVFYVDDDAPLGGDGTTWNAAYKYLQDALIGAPSGTEIRIGGGTYWPDRDEAGYVTPGDREATFQLISGVGLYGGYAGLGDPGEPDHRDIEVYETVLSGDLNDDDAPVPCTLDSPDCDSSGRRCVDGFCIINQNNSENSYHVVTASSTDATAVLGGFVITAGNANGQGGGIYVGDGSPTVATCTVSGNSADTGAGVYNSENSPLFTNCTFSGNSAEVHGGGMANGASSPTLTNCTFTGNFAWVGGAMMNAGNPSVVNCTFIGNLASSSGGALANGPDSSPTLTNCTLTGNLAGEDGAGMYISGSSPTLTNCTFSKNSARARGGGIHINAFGTTTLTNCVLSGNTDDGSGTVESAQIFDDGTDGPVVTYTLIQGLDIFSPGTGNIDGDPLFVDGDGPDGTPGTEDDDLRLLPSSPCIDAGDNTAVLPDTADLDGDGDTAERTPLDLDGNPRFVDDPDTDDTGVSDPPDYPEIVDMGAYEYRENALYVDDDASLGGNGARWSTAYKHLQDVLIGAASGTEIRVAGGTYKPDQGEDGNVIPGDRSATFQLISGAELYGGYAGLANPGNPDERIIGVYETVLSGDLNGDDPVNESNCCKPHATPGCDDSECQEAVCALASGCCDAGRISWEPWCADHARDICDICGPGGFDDNSYHVVTGSDANETAVLDGLTISHGNADAGADPHYHGGGMYNFNGDPTVANCTFSGNSAAFGGGGMYNYGSNPTLANCTFIANWSSVYIDQSGGGGMYNVNSSPTLTNCMFTDNFAAPGAPAIGGGGMCNKGGTPTLINCTFSSNSAGESGGGMRNMNNSNPTLTNCTFGGNSADYFGGGMSNAVSSNPTLTNCIFTGNTAANWGGGIFNESGSPTLTNCAFTGNSAAYGGGGMYNYGSNPTLANCILWGNTPDELFNYDGAVGDPTVRFSDLLGGLPTGTIDGGGNIDADPLFVDADGPDGIPGTEDDNLRLMPGSPCIDAADNTAVPPDVADLDGDGDTAERTPLDLDGNPRFVDDPDTDDTGIPDPPDYEAVVDMGAYEYFAFPDCNNNGIADACDLVCGMPGSPCDVGGCGQSQDVNGNGVPDECVLMVNVHGSAYDNEGFNIYQTLLGAGGAATHVNLSSDGQAAALIQANAYDQVWLFDLSSRGDNYPTDWQAIADWSNADQSRVIICDARMIASYWDGRWTDEGQLLTENYFENMKTRGGGLVLGTDHNIFHAGINTVNQLIGLEPFHGNFHLTSIPVDTANPLMNTPNDLGPQLWDDSSPGQAPYGVQPNGRTLYSLAWHSGDVDTPGISSTIQSFSAHIVEPVDGSTFHAGKPVTFTAEPVNGDPPFTYEWSSNLDGPLGNEETIIATLSAGTHEITVVAEDGMGHQDDDSIMVTVLLTSDLELTDCSAPSEADAGGPISVAWTVTNIGELEVTGLWGDAVYLSDDELVGDDIELGSFLQGGPLGYLDFYEPSESVFVPGELCGEYWVIVATDVDNSVEEPKAEDNNARVCGNITIRDSQPPETNITSGPPDGAYLNTSAVTFAWEGEDNCTPTAQLTYSYCLETASASCDPSGPFELETTVTLTELTEEDSPYVFKVAARDLAGNVDPTPAERSFTSDVTPVAVLGHSPDGEVNDVVCAVELTFSEPPVGFDIEDVELIGPNGSITVTSVDNTVSPETYEFRFECQLGTGPYDFTVGPDIFDLAGNPMDEPYAGSFFIALPNLTVSSGLGLPLEGWVGQQIDVGWTVTNTGTVPTKGSWQDCIYSSTNGEIGDDDDELWVCMPRPVDLDASAYYNRVGRVTVPDLAEGDYWIIVKVNDGHELTEMEYTDNDTIGGPIHIRTKPCADLEPQSIVVPTTPVAAGGEAYVDWTVTNVGDGATNVPFWFDRIYLSRDQTLGRGDRPIAPDFQNPMALNSGESYLQDDAEFLVPGDLLGDYYAIVKTDARGNVSECDEDNNVGVSKDMLRVVPYDATLTVTNVEVSPPDPWPGDPVTVTWTLTNTGNVSTGPFEAVHTIVLDTARDDRVLDTTVGAISANLRPGQTSEPIGITVWLPLDVWGANSITVTPNVVQGADLKTWAGSAPITIETPFVADLVVDDFDSDPTAVSCEPVALTWRVRNVANELTLANAWEDAVIISVDDSLDSTDDNTELGRSVHTGALDLDQYYEARYDITLPRDAEGVYYVFICTDAADQVFEGDTGGEDNNCTGPSPIDVQYLPPDLEVASVLVPGDEPVLSGTPITVNWTVINNGTGTTCTSGWSDRIYVSADDVLDDEDTVLATPWYSGWLVPAGSYEDEREVTIPLSFVADAAHIFVCTDVADRVYESDEENNCTEAPTTLEILWGPADLEVVSVSVLFEGEPATFVPSGSAVTVEWQVYNNGPGATSVSSWYDQLYISHDDTLDGSDWVLAAVAHFGTLAAGQGYPAGPHEVAIPIDFTGPAYIIVKTDYSGSAAESDTSNNDTPSDPFEVVWGLPDLVVEGISAPSGAIGGESLDLSWTIRNLGGPTTEGSWNDHVYLSNDRWLSGDDDVLSVVPHSGDLGYAEAYTTDATVDLPPNLADQFYLIVEADGENDILESDEENNTYTRQVAILVESLPVDLVVTDIDAPSTALSGQSMFLTWTVANTGTGATPTGSWRDGVYLSPDQYLDRGYDYYLGYFTHSGVLDPGGGPGDSYVRTEGVRIPNGLSGPYYVFVATDISDYVYEENDGGDAEQNNQAYDRLATQVEIPPPADLAVSQIILPTEGTLGQDVTVEWSVHNSGNFEAQGSWHDSVYISADTAWDIGDKKIGKVRHTGPLAAAAEYTEPLTAPLPGVVPGDYYIIARTDIHNEVRETLDGEENNITPSVDTILVEITELQLGVPHYGTLANGEGQHFSVCVAADETLRIILDSDAATGINELYVRYEQVADRARYDVAYGDPFDPDQTVVVPTTQAGCYYVYLYCDHVAGGSAGYVLLAESVPFGIESVTPERIGDNGQVTITLHGARFQASAQARLIDGETVLTPEAVTVLDGATAKARFFFESAPHGEYDVELENPDSLVALKEGAVTIETATDTDLDLIMTGNLTPRVGTVFRAEGSIINNGNVDAPYVTVTAVFDAEVTIGWWRPEYTLPRQSDYPDADWLNDSPTAQFYNGYTGDVLLLRDLEPRRQVRFTSRIRGFPAGPFQFHADLKPATRQEFDKSLLGRWEMLRRYLLDNDPPALPEPIIEVLNDPSEWEAFGRSIFVETGLIDPSSTGNTSVDLSRFGPLATDQTCMELCHAPCTEMCLDGLCRGILYDHILTCAIRCAPACTTGPPCLACFVGCASLLTVLHYSCHYLCDPFCDPVCWMVCNFPPPFGQGETGWFNGHGYGMGQRPTCPNEKNAPPGFGDLRFIGLQEPLPYTVHFENIPEATAWAAEVTITDQLSPDLDWRTLQLGEIAFSDNLVLVPEQRPHYVGELELANGLIVRINAGIDVESGRVTWRLTAIDPETGEIPDDPFVGVLPPNDPETHSGEGYLTFTIRPMPDLPTGTEITNAAAVIFDINEPLETNLVFNTVDSGAPSSSVISPTGWQPNSSFDVQWTGQDDEGGCGVDSYSIYFSLDGQPYVEWITTRDTLGTFTGARGGGTYGFYSVATDHVGNREDPPDTPDTTVTVAVQVPFAPTIAGATATTVTLVNLGTANVDSVEHAVFEERSGKYVAADGRLRDEPFWQPLDQWAGFVVRALEPRTQFRFRVQARSTPGDETAFGPAGSAITRGQGDVDGNGRVSQGDISIVQGVLGTAFGDAAFDPRADLNGDDEVTYADLGIVELMKEHNGDFNGDDRVELVDAALFVACTDEHGPGAQITPESASCAHGDFDLDNDLDLADFAAFQQAFGMD